MQCFAARTRFPDDFHIRNVSRSERIPARNKSWSSASKTRIETHRHCLACDLAMGAGWADNGKRTWMSVPLPGIRRKFNLST